MTLYQFHTRLIRLGIVVAVALIWLFALWVLR